MLLSLTLVKEQDLGRRLLGSGGRNGKKHNGGRGERRRKSKGEREEEEIEEEGEEEEEALNGGKEKRAEGPGSLTGKEVGTEGGRGKGRTEEFRPAQSSTTLTPCFVSSLLPS